MSDIPKLGATGKFPAGKLGDSDEGELVLAIANHKGKVLLNFGKPVTFLGMDPQGAVDFATGIISHARAAAKDAGVPLVVRVG